MSCASCEKRRLMSEAKHLAQSASKVIKAAVSGDDVIASKDKQKERYLICEQCEHVSRKNGMPQGSTVLSGDKCLECGCYILAKIKFETEACPIRKW